MNWIFLQRCGLARPVTSRLFSRVSSPESETTGPKIAESLGKSQTAVQSESKSGNEVLAKLLEKNPSLLRPRSSYANNFSYMRFTEDENATNALQAFQTAKYQCVSEELGFGYLETESSLFPDMETGRNVLFVRRFYPQLFAHLRKYRRAVLLGNPGTSKSTFQAYYIYQYIQSIFNPKALALPPNHLNRTDPPKVILRQKGSKKMQLMFLEESLCFWTKPDPGLINPFNPETTEYLFDPADDLTGPSYDELTLPIKATCSPDEQRYKEFCKNGAIKAYMPCWSEEELLLAAQILRDKGQVPQGMDYSDRAIRDRFYQFGGIIRHVLPSTSDYLEDIKKAQESRLTMMPADRLRILAQFPEIELSVDHRPQTVSHLLMQYEVKEGEFGPKSTSLKIASPYVINQLTSTLDEIDLMNAHAELKMMFLTPSQKRPETFEIVVAEFICRNLWKWQIHHNRNQSEAANDDASQLESKPTSNESSSSSGWKEFQFPKLQLDPVIQSQVKSFKDMEEGTLYRVCNHNNNFPLVDMFYKSAADELTGIQVTFSKSHKKPMSAFKQFKEKLKLEGGVRIRLMMVSIPEYWDEYAKLEAHSYVGTPEEVAESKTKSKSKAQIQKDQKEKEEFLRLHQIQIYTLKFEAPHQDVPDVRTPDHGNREQKV